MGDFKEKDWLKGNLSFGHIKLTSVIEFASFLEPNSDAFHGLFSFNEIAVTISATRAAFPIWN